MSNIVSNGLFGIVLSLLTYKIGVMLNQKFKSPILNPLLIAVVLIIPILKVFHIPYDSFNVGGQIITLFLGPATTVLAYSIYMQLEVLKKYWLPVLVGCLTSCLVSMGSVIAFCKLFGFNDSLTGSMIPKSVTTPIAMSVSEKLGGVSGITVAAVIVTGIFGAVILPVLAKLLRIKNPVGVGVALGCSCHAIGTARALEIGEIQGAMSSIALSVAGIITVVISLFL